MTEGEPRQLPSFVWIAMIANIALHLANLLVVAADARLGWLGARVMVASNAMTIATMIVLGLAIAHLGRRLIGAAAIGARVATWAIAGSVALFVVRQIYAAIHTSYDADVTEVLWYVRWVIGLTATIGLIIAANRSRGLMIAGGAIALVQDLPPIVWEKISHVTEPHSDWFSVLNLGVVALGTTGTMLLLYAAARTETPLPSLAIRGFRLASRGVWLRVIAAITGVCATFLMFSASHGSGKAIEVALVAALIVNMLSFAMFGIGAIQVACANLDGMPRFVLGAAGVLALWCCGVMSMQPAALYRAMNDRGFLDSDFFDALSIAQPLIATLSAALLAGGIAVFASARGDSGGLGRQARSAGVVFVCLMLFSLLAQYGLIRGASSMGGAAMVMLLAAVCGLIAQVALAQLCTAASNAIDSEPVIPTAIVRP